MPDSHMIFKENLTLPYGPTRGMLQALQLMRKTPPHKVDGNFLRHNQIAPGNEYKVVGALRFLGIIDDDGIPTEKSRLLKTKGAVFTAALQNIIRGAYSNLFQHLNENKFSQEAIFNYFITEEGLGTEMATKTTRFFIQLCHLAEIDLELRDKEKTTQVAKNKTNGSRKSGENLQALTGGTNPFPIIIALTPEMASMDVAQLTSFFKNLKSAVAQANAD